MPLGGTRWSTSLRRSNSIRRLQRWCAGTVQTCMPLQPDCISEQCRARKYCRNMSVPVQATSRRAMLQKRRKGATWLRYTRVLGCDVCAYFIASRLTGTRPKRAFEFDHMWGWLLPLQSEGRLRCQMCMNMREEGRFDRLLFGPPARQR